MSWAKISNNEKYLNFLKSIGDSLQWKGGPEPFFADDYCVGQTWAEMFMIYKDSVMIKPMMQIGDSIINRPHTESLEWNFEGGLHNREWAWCDALYMGPPMLAYLSKATGQKKYLDIADSLWWRSTHFLYDTKEILNSLGVTQKELREICVLSGTDYNYISDDNSKNAPTLYKTLSYFKKYHKEKVEIGFYQW